MRELPVSFGDLTFPLISISSNPLFVGSDDSDIDADVKSFISIHQNSKNPEEFVTELRVQLEKKDDNSLPYAFNILCFLPLKVDSDVPDNKRKSIALKASHSLAFPAVRELIINLTARQPHGQFSIGLGQLLSADEAPPLPSPKKRFKTVKANTALK